MLSLTLISCTHGNKVDQFARLWVRDTEPTNYVGEHLSQPIFPVYNKAHIITANGVNGLTAYTKKWGSIEWTLDIEGGVSSPLLLVSNYVFFTGYDGNAYSVNVEDGKIFWKKQIGYPSTQALFYENGRIYTYTKNSEILALEASSGDQVWTYSRKNQRKISVGAIGNFVSLGPLLISGLATGEVVALEKANGKVRWIRKLNFNPRFRDIKTLIIYDTDKLIVAGYDDHIYNLEALSGALKWKRKFSVVTNFLPIKSQDVCFGTSEKLIKCITASTGVETSSFPVKSIPGQMTKIDDTSILYGLSTGGIEILNLETKVKIKYPTLAGVSHAPVWNPEKREIYFNSNKGNIYVLKLKSEYSEFL